MLHFSFGLPFIRMKDYIEFSCSQHLSGALSRTPSKQEIDSGHVTLNRAHQCFLLFYLFCFLLECTPTINLRMFIYKLNLKMLSRRNLIDFGWYLISFFLKLQVIHHLLTSFQH